MSVQGNNMAVISSVPTLLGVLSVAVLLATHWVKMAPLAIVSYLVVWPKKLTPGLYRRFDQN